MSVNRKGTKAFILMISAATSMLVIGCSSSTDDGPTMPTQASVSKAAVSKAAATTTTTKSSADDNPFGFSFGSDDNSPPSDSNDSGSDSDDSDGGGFGSGPTLDAATGSYPGNWKGGGRTMTLNPDGTGTMKLDDSEYVIAWANEGAGITVTVKTVTVKKDGAEKAGKVWHGALQQEPDGDTTVLHLADKASDLKEMFSGMFWCTGDADSFLCGGE